MLINLRNALMSGKRLPYDAEVEYLRVDAVGPYIVIDGVTYCNAVGTYYAFTISSGGVVTHDLIPVRLGNTGYMYDRITNKRFGNEGSGDFVLGPDVVPVEYIESHRTEWIDTGLQLTSTDRVDCRFALTNISGNTERINGQTGIDLRFAFGKAGSNVNFYTGLGNLNYWTTLPLDTQPHDLALDAPGRTVTIDRQSWPVAWTAFADPDGSASWSLFARTTIPSGNIGTYAKERLYWAKIYRSAIPVRSFRPIRVGTDATSWEGAMMDVLTRRIYRNAGTGAFGYGNDLKYPIPAA